MARQKLGEGETMRLHLKISPEEVEEIDNWRFANRADNRSDAMRRLMAIGLIASRTMRELNERRLPRLLKHLLEEDEDRDNQLLNFEAMSLFQELRSMNDEMARFYRDDAFEKLQELAEKATLQKEDDA